MIKPDHAANLYLEMLTWHFKVEWYFFFILMVIVRVVCDDWKKNSREIGEKKLWGSVIGLVSENSISALWQFSEVFENPKCNQRNGSIGINLARVSFSNVE